LARTYQERNPPCGPQNEEHAQQNVADEAKPDKVDECPNHCDGGKYQREAR
jgi:hypothetical protein